MFAIEPFELPEELSEKIEAFKEKHGNVHNLKLLRRVHQRMETHIRHLNLTIDQVIQDEKHGDAQKIGILVATVRNFGSNAVTALRYDHRNSFDADRSRFMEGAAVRAIPRRTDHELLQSMIDSGFIKWTGKKPSSESEAKRFLALDDSILADLGIDRVELAKIGFPGVVTLVEQCDECIAICDQYAAYFEQELCQWVCPPIPGDPASKENVRWVLESN